MQYAHNRPIRNSMENLSDDLISYSGLGVGFLQEDNMRKIADGNWGVNRMMDAGKRAAQYPSRK